jgi:adenylate cyclase
VQPRRLHALLLLVPVLALVAWLASSPLWQGLDAQLQDRVTRGVAITSAPSNVVLVDIDEASLAQLGPWPWPRTVLADLVSRLRVNGAQVQAWDVHFPEPATGDDRFLAALTAGKAGAGSADVAIGQVLILDPQVQMPPRLGTLRPSPTAPELCSGRALEIMGHLGVADSLPAVPAGHLTATTDPDGGLRRLPAVICSGTQRFPQLTLAAAELLEPTAAWQTKPGQWLLGPAQWLERGRLRFALDREGYLQIPYRHTHSQWTAVSALQVLEGSHRLPDLKGKVVIVGATALGLADTVATPFHGNAPGVSVHAELMAAAMDGAWVSSSPYPALPAVLICGLLALALVGAASIVRGLAGLFLAGAAVAMLPLALAWVARSYLLVWPISAPTAGLVVFAFALVGLQIETARRQARLLAGHLQSFLPRDLAIEIARQNPSGESLGRHESGVVLTLRVAGLERWCAAADSLKALGLIHAVSSLAQKHSQLNSQGQLEHMQGDTLVLAWAAPAASEPAALREAVQSAVQTARGLHAELGALLSQMETERHPLGLMAAIEAGPYLLAVAGSAASRRTLVLGPAVDVALGLLGLSEELASPLLLGQRAAGVGLRVATQPMGHFLLPDSSQPQSVHRVEP